MRKDWEPHWCPSKNMARTAEASWHKIADDADFGVVSEESPDLTLPNWDDFAASMMKASGSAGFDGWTATEVHAMLKHLKPFAKELYELWCETSLLCATQRVVDSELNCLLWPWKVVSIP